MEMALSAISLALSAISIGGRFGNVDIVITSLQAVAIFPRRIDDCKASMLSLHEQLYTHVFKTLENSDYSSYLGHPSMKRFKVPQ